MAMDLEKLIKAILLLASVFGIPFGVYNYMNELHATKAEIEAVKKKTLHSELEVRGEIIDTEIDRKAEIRHHYKQLEATRALEPAEAARVEYLEDSLEREYQKQDMIQEQLMQMEKEE